MLRLLMLCALTLGLSFQSHAIKPTCVQSHCLAVIDAGSSGSRLHVYDYELDATGSPISINEVWSRKVLPGLSTIEHEHGSISLYMEKLFTDAPTVLMPVYFYSTAGMRLLPKSYHSNVNQLVANWFDKQYYWRLITARTISGQEEGVLAWLALNYRLGLLMGSEEPAGVLDVGGASVQIVFPAANTAPASDDSTVQIDLYGKHFNLKAESFLGLGQNEMAHQYTEKDSCFPKEYELPSGASARGDGKNCKKAITTLVNRIHQVDKKVKPILSLNSAKKWYIMGGITNLFNDELFSFTNHQFTPIDLLEKADEKVCHQNWNQLEKNYPQNFMLHNYCILPSYINSLVVEGYGIKPNQQINYMPAHKAVDWTVGVVLQHHKG